MSPYTTGTEAVTAQPQEYPNKRILSEEQPYNAGIIDRGYEERKVLSKVYVEFNQ